MKKRGFIYDIYQLLLPEKLLCCDLGQTPDYTLTKYSLTLNLVVQDENKRTRKCSMFLLDVRLVRQNLMFHHPILIDDYSCLLLHGTISGPDLYS
jgi:hypothetical protein